MSPASKLLLDGVYVSHKRKDNTIVLSSTEIDDFHVVVEKKSHLEHVLRKMLSDKGAMNKNLSQTLENFSLQGVSNAEYNSGMFILHIRSNDKISYLKVPEQHFTFYQRNLSTGQTMVGLNCESISTIGLSGAGGSGKSTFIKEKFLADNSMVVNFSQLSYKSLSPDERENYGNYISQNFLRDDSKKFLVLDHIPAGHKEKKFTSHPALYSDTVYQIYEYANFFRKAGKTLILSGVDEDGTLGKMTTDAVISFFGMNTYMNYGFSFDGIDFPAINLIQ